MSTLLVVLLVLIVVVAAGQAGQKARAARRTAQDHQRALDTLGHITGHPAEESGQALPEGEGVRPHVRVFASHASGAPSRWARRVSPPPAVPTVAPPPPPPAAGGPTNGDLPGADSPPTMEVAVPVFPPRPHPASQPTLRTADDDPTVERHVTIEHRGPEPGATDHAAAEALRSAGAAGDVGGSPAQPGGSPAQPAWPPAQPAWSPAEPAWSPAEPVHSEAAAEGPVVRIDDLAPDPVARPFAGSPRSPSTEIEAPPAMARVLHQIAPAPGRHRRRRHRATAQPRFRRRQPRRTPAGTRRRAAVWVSGVSALAVLAAAGAAIAFGVGPTHTNKDLASPPPPSPQPVTTTTLPPPPPPAVRLVSSTSAQATYDVVGSPLTKLVASGRCWVEVRQGSSTGKILYEGVMTAGQSKDLAGPLWLRLGYPEAVAVTINGTSLNAPGLSSGQPYNLAVG